jgi:hypothetical protein
MDTTAGMGMGVADMMQSSAGLEGAGLLVNALNPQTAVAAQQAADEGADKSLMSAANLEGKRLSNQAARDTATDRQTEIQQQGFAENAALQSAGRDVAIVQDYGTMLGAVGTETFPSQAKGIMGGMRLQMLDLIRRTTEAGALQQAEIELFNEVIPEYDEWIKLTPATREGKMQQFQYWMQTKGEDAALAQGRSIQDVPNLGRSYEEIIRPISGTNLQRGWE